MRGVCSWLPLGDVNVRTGAPLHNVGRAFAPSQHPTTRHLPIPRGPEREPQQPSTAAAGRTFACPRTMGRHKRRGAEDAHTHTHTYNRSRSTCTWATLSDRRAGGCASLSSKPAGSSLPPPTGCGCCCCMTLQVVWWWWRRRLHVRTQFEAIQVCRMNHSQGVLTWTQDLDWQGPQNYSLFFNSSVMEISLADPRRNMIRGLYEIHTVPSTPT